MKRIIVGAVAALFLLTGCGQAPWEKSLQDVEGAEVRDPDYIHLTNNVDKHPNIVVLCTKGLGFFTTTRPDFGSVGRVPELDAYCQSVEGEGSTTDLPS